VARIATAPEAMEVPVAFIASAFHIPFVNVGSQIFLHNLLMYLGLTVESNIVSSKRELRGGKNGVPSLSC
jgi:hypothetical protein